MKDSKDVQLWLGAPTVWRTIHFHTFVRNTTVVQCSSDRPGLKICTLRRWAWVTSRRSCNQYLDSFSFCQLKSHKIKSWMIIDAVFYVTVRLVDVGGIWNSCIPWAHEILQILWMSVIQKYFKAWNSGNIQKQEGKPGASRIWEHGDRAKYSCNYAFLSLLKKM